MYLSQFFNCLLFKPKTLLPVMHVHGVFIQIYGKGVLIIGKSGIGKSEVALDLIHKGHTLISDDSVAFHKDSKNRLIGEAPPLLKNLLEVRGLGVLNIQKLFGRKSVTKHSKLFLAIELITSQKKMNYSRLEMNIHPFKLFDIEMPKIKLSIDNARHISLLIETAVKNYALISEGFDATKDLSQKLNFKLRLDS